MHDPGAAGEYARVVRPLLDADPVRHTVLLTVLDGLVRDRLPAAHLLTVHDGGSLVGASLRTPGRCVQVSAMPAAVMPRAERVLADADPGIDGVAGPIPEAEAFAAARVARTACGARVRLRTRLFALGELRPPVGVRGAARRAVAPDVAMLGRWRHAFELEERHPGADLPAATAVVERAVAGGSGELVWEDDGVPVSYASARPVVAGMSRIGPVYTPPEHRRHGYAAAVTAAAARWALDAGARTVLLFTDLANPTTNALYPRIGFGPVHDSVELSFR